MFRLFHWAKKSSSKVEYFLFLKEKERNNKITHHDLGQELPGCTHSLEGCGLLPEGCLCLTSLFDHPKGHKVQGEDFVDFSHPA